MINTNNKAYIFIHTIWAVKDRQPLLTKPVRKILFAHIQKSAEEKGTKILIINGIEDHVHCLVQLHPTQNLSKVLKDIKGESSHWLNETQLLKEPFEWQDGYAAYSVSPTSVKNVMDYIYHQEQHHQSQDMEKELQRMEDMVAEQKL